MSRKNITEVYTTDILFGLIPGLTLMAIYTDQGVKLIAQNKNASFLVIDAIKNEPILFESEAQFLAFLKFIGMDEIKMMLPKKSVFLN